MAKEHCQMMSGQSWYVIQAIVLTVKIFLIESKFLIFEHCPVPHILGADFFFFFFTFTEV
jgi:hypothetical protein